MTRIAIDGKISEFGPDNVGQVTTVVREALTNLPPNRLITKILVDGVEVSTLDLEDEPASAPFRELEIKTVDREIWAVNGFDTALSSIERVQRSLIKAAELFREENKAHANRFFVQCIDGLERFYEAVMITRSVLKLDFKLIDIHGIKLSVIESDFSDILRTIIDLQERQDWTALADKVDYELITNLSSWTSALKQLRLSQMSNA